MQRDPDKSVILFDGVCNLCNNSVNFIMDRDPKFNFYFASLQSEVGQELLEENDWNGQALDSIILVDSNGKVYHRSTAALRIARRMGGLWPVLYAFIIVPAFIRDIVYKWIARNRYRWFGKRETCRLPTPEEREHFLEQAPASS